MRRFLSVGSASHKGEFATLICNVISVSGDDQILLMHDIRSQFPALARTVNGNPVAHFDGPAGSQVPQCVADAVSHYLLHANANCGAPIITSHETDALLHEARQAAADFVGADDCDEIIFGANMTSLTFAFSRALSRTWKSGDEVVVTRLDHDANVSPWVLAARDAGAVVKHIDVHPDDGTLDMESARRALTDRTKLLAVGWASNITGTVNPVRELVEMAHAVGALAFIDAVHYAPHRRLNVQQIDCDFLVCSAYKFFGPHIGMLWGRREHLESITPYKVRPATDAIPGRWMTGTQNHEGICGITAAIDYIAGVGEASSAGRAALSRRARLDTAFAAIRQHEESLLTPLLAGLQELPGVRIWGISDLDRFDERVATVSVTHPRQTPRALATRLADQGLFVWPGNHYALSFTEAMGLEPGGTLRIGILHYNTREEVDRLLAALRAMWE